MAGSTPFPHANLGDPNDDKEDGFGELVEQQLAVPVQPVNWGGSGAPLRVTMPLSQVVACSATVTPSAVDHLLVLSPTAKEPIPAPPITPHGFRHAISDDIGRVQNVPALEHASSLKFQGLVLNVKAQGGQRGGAYLEASSYRT